MEQRALVAIALVAGSVTAAGAGGYLAVRQMAGPANPAPAAQVVPAQPDAVPPGVLGTEAEIAPLPEEPVGAPERAADPVARRVTPEAAPRKAAARAAVTRPAAATAPPTPAPATTSRPESTYRGDPAPAAAPVRAEPRPTAPAASPTASTDDGWSTSANWPARDTANAPQRDDWPEADTTAAGADATLPSRAPMPASSPAPVATRRLESVTIPSDSVIGVQIENTVSTATARVEDPVRARVTRDVRVGGTVVAPAGSRLLGNVTLVEEGGKIRERARLGVRFHTLVLADGTEVRLPTETVYRDGESPAGKSAAKIGGAAAGGAILGAILGGGRGAIIGAATGAGGGTAAAMAGQRRPAELRAGQPITVRVTDNVTTEVER